MRRPFIFFDFGGTLTTGEQSMSSVVRGVEFYEELIQLFKEPEVYQSLQQSVILDNVSAFTKTVLDWLREEHIRRMTSDLEKDSMTMWSEIIGIEEQAYDSPFALAAEDASVALETYQIGRHIRPEVEEAMERLSQQGYGLGVISNINSRTRVPKELVSYGLNQWFSPVVISSHIGWRKPHPMIFHYAASLAGVPASECWHVGDMVSRDVVGARRAGFGGVVHITGSSETIDPTLRERWPHFFFEPNATIDSLLELEQIIASSHKSNPSTRRKAVIFTPASTQINPTSLKPIIENLRNNGWLTAIAGHYDQGAIQLFNTLEAQGLATLWDAIQVDATRLLDALVDATRQQLMCESSATVAIACDGESPGIPAEIHVINASSLEFSTLEEDMYALSMV